MFKERAKSRFLKEKSARELAIRSSSNKVYSIGGNSNRGGGAASTGKKKNTKSTGLKSLQKIKFQSISESILKPENQQLLRAQSYQGNLPLITRVPPQNYHTIDPDQDDDLVIKEIDEPLLDPFESKVQRKNHEQNCALLSYENEVKEAGNMILQLYQQKMLQ